ncbi:MAG TPA: S9 family peptidase [Aliidongia sp.]|nr:S9 family peptidase [Aliidongia sp.]
MTVQDLWAMKRVGAPTLSPDGKWACVPVTGYDMDKNEGTSQLWLLSTDGKSQRQLTRGMKDSSPQWSPDGKWIAFVAKRGEGKDADEEAQLYLIQPEGGEAERLTSLATGVSAPRWFPDGSGLAFVSWVWPELSTERDQAKRYKEEKESKVKASVIDTNHYRYWDHWLPRGRKPHLHIVDRQSGKVRDLFAGTPYHLPPQDPGAALFDISPDSGEIAFTHDVEADPGVFSFTDIFVMEVKSGKAKNLTEKTGRPSKRASAGPRYSPDGKTIAFLGTEFGKSHNEQDRAWLIQRQGGAETCLTGDWDRGVNGPLVWTIDGKALYFTAETEVAQPIWRLPIEGGKAVEIRRGPNHGGVAGEICLSADGKTLAYLRAAMVHPPALFAADADGGKERQIERFNTRLLGQLTLTEPETVTIKGAGGDPVQMWILPPPGFDKKAKAKWPLMQVIHGGPHTCWGDTWHWRWNSQLFAAPGYVVAAVNYHGSTGWGQKFLSSINGDWGKRELADVEAGTDYMLATGYIDEKRMVATGGSYGGYMVAYMNGNVPAGRYQAYVCHAGCYDWVSMMGSDGYFWFGHELGCFPWEDEQTFLKQSPHYYAANFATPTLVLHGELDYRVPYYQGLAYYNTLRVRKVPSRLVFFPDENHWILKPQNSVLWYGEFFDWCEKYTVAGKGKKK